MLKKTLLGIALFSALSTAKVNSVEFTTTSKIDTIYFSSIDKLVFVSDELKVEGEGSSYPLSDLERIRFVENNGGSTAIGNSSINGSNHSSVSITQNYSVAFSSNGIKLSYNLEKSSMVSVNVYDMRGRVVAQLFNGSVNAGIFSMNKSIKLGRGVYTLVINQDGQNIKSFKLVR